MPPPLPVGVVVLAAATWKLYLEAKDLKNGMPGLGPHMAGSSTTWALSVLASFCRRASSADPWMSEQITTPTLPSGVLNTVTSVPSVNFVPSLAYRLNL